MHRLADRRRGARIPPKLRQPENSNKTKQTEDKAFAAERCQQEGQDCQQVKQRQRAHRIPETPGYAPRKARIFNADPKPDQIFHDKQEAKDDFHCREQHRIGRRQRLLAFQHHQQHRRENA